LPKLNKQAAPGRRKVSTEVWLALLALARGVFVLGAELAGVATIMKTERPNETANRVEPFYAANRREFLRGGARYALLWALAAISGALVKRRVGSLPGQTCLNQGICRGCGAVGDCGLPQALSFKQVTQTRRTT